MGSRPPEDLTRFVAEHDFTGALEVTAFDAAAVAALRDRFEVALGEKVEPVVEAINLTFSEIRTLPRLVRHDEWDWHMNAAGSSAPLSERVTSYIALVFTDLVRSGDLARLSRCAASDCTAALADLTKNRSKRFCDLRNCAIRTTWRRTTHAASSSRLKERAHKESFRRCSIPIMRMSEGVEWGLHCCLVLAWLDDLAPLPVGRLAEVFDLPPEYLKKQLQPLTKAGILSSRAGARGGYWLGREPEAISLMDVVTAIEGGTDPFQCTDIRQRGAGQAGAPEEFAHPCGISMAMRKAELAWRRELANQTLADLIANTPPTAERRTRRFIERTATA